MKVELPSPDGSNVISINVLHKMRRDKHCEHLHINVDAELSNLECEDCGKEINPIQWIMMLREKWGHVTHLYETYTKAAKVWEEKQRTQCQHCKRFTKINPPNDFEKKLRALK